MKRALLLKCSNGLKFFRVVPNPSSSMVSAPLSETRKEHNMTDPISHFSRMAQMDNSVRQAARAEKRSSAPVGLASGEAAATPAPQSDELRLSDVARQAMREPEFDRAKVESIKNAIQQGQYPLDARRIAENFVALERMIKG